ncbi:MAG: hypothetical protein JW891_12355 [Candidatus Lokiarchaeota archaeon]|nr:hypothetical protein [Candidatus Lokiarchaeota archaeon]
MVFEQRDNKSKGPSAGDRFAQAVKNKEIKKSKKSKEKKKKKDKSSKKSSHSAFSTSSQVSQERRAPIGGISLGEKIDRSSDKLFVGHDYREVFSWEYERSWADILMDVEHWHLMPFTLGIEQELIVADDYGNYLPGDEMVFRMREIVKDAIKMLKQLINGQRSDFLPIPEYIKSKILVPPYGREDLEKGYVMDIRYNLPEGNASSEVDIDCFGRDGNVTAITYILELVTPPCEYVEELAFWASTLFLLAKKTLPKDLNIIASGINPVAREYTRGLTQADHFHIGSFKGGHIEKAMVYSMLRNFIPHLIALSNNSPIINNRPTDVVKIINGRITAPNCIRSLRLKYNETMLSPNMPKGFLPYLTSTDQRGVQTFLDAVEKAGLEDARMVDCFPFTDFGTIELRVCDAQISICRRIGMAILIQTLAYKARKLLMKKKWVPNAGAPTISFNRKGAYERGLISLFKPQNLTHEFLAKNDPNFAEQYLGPKNDPVNYMTQAVQRMFFYIKPELVELGFLYSPFLKPLLMSVFGEVSYATAPMSEAEYQLSLYDYKVNQGEDPNILNDLIYFTTEYCKDPISHPLTGNLTLPKEMRD